MKKIIAALLCVLMLLSLCSCRKITVEIVYDEPITEAVAPIETEPATEAPTEPVTEATSAVNVNTGEE